MMLSDDQNIFRASKLVGEFNHHMSNAELQAKMLVSWIAPNGDYYLEPKGVIDQIIASGSWR